MRLNFKKISAVLGSAVMIGSSLGIAAAAAFPTDFTSATPAIVYGNSGPLDQTPATSISTYLADKVPATGGAPTGESLKIARASTEFNLGEGIEDVISTSITDTSPGSGLPTILSNGVYLDDDNDEFDYTQKIDTGNITFNMWEDSDYAEDEPTVGIKVANGGHILNYTLEFTDQPLWSDLQSTDITILGKKYFILSYVNATTLTLLDAAQSTTLEQGESATMTINGVVYDVVCTYVGSSTVRFTINGVETNALAAGETQKVSGAYIGVKSIDSQNYADGLKRAQFSVGIGKLKLVSGSDVEMNDDSVTNLKATINYTGSSTGTKLTKVQIRWDAKDDLFVTEKGVITMPGFEAVKISSTGLKYPVEEKIKVKAGSDSYIELIDFPLKSAKTNIAIVYGDNKNFTGIGKGAGDLLGTTNDSRMRYDGDTFDQFIASWSDGKDGESYLMKITDIKNDSGTTKATFQYKDDTSSTGWSDAGANKKEGDEVSIGNIVLTVGNIDSTNKVINFTGGSNVNFRTLYTKEGMKLYLPWNETFGSASSCTYGAAAIGQLGCLNISVDSDGSTINLTLQEEDKDENKYGGRNITLTLGWNTASTKEAEVVNIVYGPGPSTTGTSTEIQSTDIFRNFVYSVLATEVLWTKPSSGQKSLDAVYHGDEVIADVYLTSSTATTGAAGSMIFKDSEKTSWETKNVILVGGSCINTATATALGVASGTCAGAFTTATGVGRGQYLIQSVGDKFTTGKLALVVAGYDAEDTAAAATKLTKRPAEIDTAKGNKYLGQTVLGETSVLTKVG
ncbi:MAG: hypothetical protein AABX30_00920 [Nanoarchaeota archaeon]